ncbi:MAG: TonB-dependent receptor plug domain-containing protein, partial [Parvibaculum sp.]|nr:TonB-dependent receptor plug domain-containing protein [Parvibaculum sp.]
MTACIALAVSPAFAQEEAGEGEQSPAVEATALRPLVVTASPFASPLEDLAAPVTIVTRDTILTSSASTLGALLKDQPGISESAFAAGASRPVIRGLDNTRVRVQENG